MDLKFVEATVMAVCLDDYLVCAHAIHQIVATFRAPSQVAFDP